MKENYELIDNEERTLRFPWSLEVKELVANWSRKCSWISRRKTYVSFRYVRS